MIRVGQSRSRQIRPQEKEQTAVSNTVFKQLMCMLNMFVFRVHLWRQGRLKEQWYYLKCVTALFQGLLQGHSINVLWLFLFYSSICLHT